MGENGGLYREHKASTQHFHLTGKATSQAAVIKRFAIPVSQLFMPALGALILQELYKGMTVIFPF